MEPIFQKAWPTEVLDETGEKKWHRRRSNVETNSTEKKSTKLQRQQPEVKFGFTDLVEGVLGNK